MRAHPSRNTVQRLGVASCALALLLGTDVPALAKLPPEVVSPPAQVTVLALNARQQRAVDLI
ncbi:MAG TPA: hypothetical protein VFK89_09655, partial [Actinomycetota bacterium]|nr:hypothetical protein [Actinomycetota bacterium]